MRATIFLSLFTGVVFLGSACVPEEEADEQGAVDAEELVEVAPVTVPELVDTAPMPAVANPDQVASCVEMVKFGALVGDAAWAQVWSDAGESDAGALTACDEIGLADPSRLQQIHTEWIGVQQEVAAAPEPPQAVEPGPARYGTCAEAIAGDGGNYRQGADPQYDWYDDRDSDGIVCENG